MSSDSPGTASIYRFGVFEFNAGTGELVKNGTPIPLQPQPAQLLRLLLSKAGELVDRELIQETLWRNEITVDFELGVNRCVRQLRAVLLDDRDTPRYIETIPRRGYRFIAPVSTGAVAGKRAPVAPAVESSIHRVAAPQKTNGHSIAVLPFANLSGDPNDEYFSDGLAEEITNALAQIGSLKVIARTSAFAFKGKNEDIRRIAETLGVDNVLEGSVRRAGNRIRVTAQLILAADGTHLFSKRYDREMTDIFALQDEISTAIADQLKIRLIVRKHSTGDVAAYEAFLEGRFHMHKGTPVELEKALECFKRAVEIDPGYGRAYTGIAEYYLGTVMDYLAKPREMLHKAAAAARRAVELDESDADAHAALGETAAMLDYDWPGAETHFRRARGLNSGPHVRMRYLFWYLLPLGRIAEAGLEADEIIKQDPVLLVGRTTKAIVLALARAYEQAAESCWRALEIEPGFPYALYLLVRIRAYQGRAEESLALAERLRAIVGKSFLSLSSLGLAQAAAGNREAAYDMLQELMSLPSGGEICATGIASIHALLNENDYAFQWMEQAVEYRDPRALWIQNLPWFDAMRSDPRYPALLKKMNLANSKPEAAGVADGLC